MMELLWWNGTFIPKQGESRREQGVENRDLRLRDLKTGVPL
jgi:hypothetical protein